MRNTLLSVFAFLLLSFSGSEIKAQSLLRNGEIEILENPNKVSGEDVLVNFELNLTEIW